MPLLVEVTADDTRVGLGSDVTLTCNIIFGDSTMTYNYTWTHMDSSTVLINETSATLNLYSFSMNEIGAYRCDVRSYDGHGIDTLTIELGGKCEGYIQVEYQSSLPPSLAVPNVISRLSPEGYVIEGTTISLVCEATARDFPIFYSWTDPNGEHIPSVYNYGGTISVTFSTDEDYGNYTCTAANAIGINTTHVEVIKLSKDNYRNH